jgi:hypothetical protein
MISDPELIITVRHAIDPCVMENNIDVRGYGYLRPYILPSFGELSKRGDTILKGICEEVVYEYFGRSSPKVITAILDQITSNDTWRHFAIVYEMDQYLVGEQRSKADDKFWGDMWEAWWAALFLERQSWNDHDEDLVSCLRVLFYFRTNPFYPDFGVDPFVPDFGVDLYFTSERAQNLALVLSKDHIETVVVGSDHPSLPISDKDVKQLGYLAKIKSTLPPYTDTSIFSQREDDAISRLTLYCSVPWSTLFPPLTKK